MNKYVYYKVLKEDEKSFDKKIKTSNLMYKKMYDPELIVCEEQAEQKIGCSIFGDLYKENIDRDDIPIIKEKVSDLRDTMYMYISSSKDYRNTIDKTFEQIYKIWRNSNKNDTPNTEDF